MFRLNFGGHISLNNSKEQEQSRISQACTLTVQAESWLQCRTLRSCAWNVCILEKVINWITKRKSYMLFALHRCHAVSKFIGATSQGMCLTRHLHCFYLFVKENYPVWFDNVNYSNLPLTLNRNSGYIKKMRIADRQWANNGHKYWWYFC